MVCSAASVGMLRPVSVEPVNVACVSRVSAELSTLTVPPPAPVEPVSMLSRPPILSTRPRSPTFTTVCGFVPVLIVVWPLMATTLKVFAPAPAEISVVPSWVLLIVNSWLPLPRLMFSDSRLR